LQKILIVTSQKSKMAEKPQKISKKRLKNELETKIS